LIGVVANLAPALDRACVAKGTLQQLGFGDVPVGIGMPVYEGKVHPYETDIQYKSLPGEVEPNGENLMVRLLREADAKSITLVLQSGMTDAASLLRNHETLFVEKIKQVVVMGGVQVDGEKVLMTGSFFQPDSANNVTYDWASGVYLYARLQEISVPMVITTRHAAYACQIPFHLYDVMETSGNPIATCLKNRQRPSLESLWGASCSSEGSEIRGTLPMR
jgi:hypothetical protein